MASSSSSSSSTVSKPETYYAVLEISRNATSQEIKDAYKRLAILRHPDKNLGDEVGACANFQKVLLFLTPLSPPQPSPEILFCLKYLTLFLQLQAAYSILSDPFSRANYDNNLDVLNSNMKTQAPESPLDSDMETHAPESPQQDFSDDELSSAAPSLRSETSVPPTPRPEFEEEYFDLEDDDDNNRELDEDDDNGLEWRTIAWLQNAILESGCKINEYNKKMGILAALVEDGKDYPIEWDELRGNLYREMRYEEGLKRDLNKLMATNG